MRRARLSKILYFGFAIALATGLSAPIGCIEGGSGSSGLDAWSSGLEVQTEFGAVNGYAVEDAAVLAWRGIPFAAPPVGNLRWQAPRDPAPWAGTREATRSGAPCIQFEMTRTFHPTGRIVGNEDCLYLDIYRPDTEEKDLPVYFWIHGGSNKFGGAAQYAPYAVAMAENMAVAVVVVQYRLGPFGWFRYAGLRDSNPENASNSGNFGTLDQIQALKWVRNNIAEFGGNPDNITIAGQSAGGHNVKNLLVTPLAAGLFHKAVSQSGIMSVADPNDNTAQTVIETLQLQGADLDAQLRNAGAAAILNASRGENFNAFADGHVIPDTVANAVKMGAYNRVPVMLGFNENEYFNLLPWYLDVLGKPDWDNVHDLFDPDFDPARQWTYRDIFPDGTDEEALYQLAGTYASMSYRARYLDEFATCLSNQQEHVYGFVFEWAGGGVAEMAEFRKVFGAAHSMEIPFFFGGDNSYFGYAFIEENETGRKALQGVMQAYLYNFMTTGTPGTAGGGTPWKAWSNGEGLYKAITFDADAAVPRLGYIQDALTFEDAEAYLAARLSGLDPTTAAAWGNMLPQYFGQEPECTP